MTEDEVANEAAPTIPGTSPTVDEELIQSSDPGRRSTEFWRRVELLVPAGGGRRLLVGIAVTALALGLTTGFLVGNAMDGGGAAGPKAAQPSTAIGPPPEGGNIPILPEHPGWERVVMVWSSGTGLLRIEDLAVLGETASSGSLDYLATSGLDEMCGITSSPESLPVPQAPGVVYSVFGSGIVSFRLVDATVGERVGPLLAVVAATAQLHGTIELARTCPSSDGLTVRTEGVRAGIGDEYAVFTVSRLQPESGGIETTIVVLVRVGGQVIEITLTPDGGDEVPDGLARGLRIAEVAVARMLAG